MNNSGWIIVIFLISWDEQHKTILAGEDKHSRPHHISDHLTEHTDHTEQCQVGYWITEFQSGEWGLGLKLSEGKNQRTVSGKRVVWQTWSAGWAVLAARWAQSTCSAKPDWYSATLCWLFVCPLHFHTAHGIGPRVSTCYQAGQQQHSLVQLSPAAKMQWKCSQLKLAQKVGKSSEPLNHHPHIFDFFSNSKKSVVLLTDGFFPSWKINRATFVIFLCQTQKNG